MDNWEPTFDEEELVDAVLSVAPGGLGKPRLMAVCKRIRIRLAGLGTRLVAAVEDALRGQPRVPIADVWHAAERFYRWPGSETSDAILLRQRSKPRD
jgi:hypothetical protein